MSAALSLWPLMTVDEFLAWPGDGVNKWHQLIDGRAVPMNPPSWAHAVVATRLIVRLNNHFVATGRDCEAVGGAGVQPRAGAHRNVRIPDVGVCCGPVPGPLMQGMVFAAEVLSPSNEAETREAVRNYLTIPSVREVLVLGSTVMAGELLTRQPDGDWPNDPMLLDEDDGIVLQTFGFRCPLAALYPG